MQKISFSASLFPVGNHLQFRLTGKSISLKKNRTMSESLKKTDEFALRIDKKEP